MSKLIDEQAPFQEVSVSKPTNNILQWSDFTITTPKEDRIILNQLSGEMRSGQSLAIMGSSGAGKTTFLNFLSKKSGATKVGLKKKSGQVKFIVNEVDQTSSFRKLSGYVTQDDILIEIMTPRELFTFAANMRLPNKTKNEREDLVEGLITRLGLDKCADTRVGDVLMKGLSGGERKRTAIGYELITDPTILFLDEPTTGLDANSAIKIVKLITEEARVNNRIVIFTIHQPNTEIFNMFDSLLLLAQGKTMYKGNAKNAIAYFSSLGFECPINYNPAEFFIKILSKETKAVDSIDMNKSWKDDWKKRKSFLKQEENNDNVDSTKSFINFSPPDQEEFMKDMKQYDEQIEKFNIKFKEIDQITDLSKYPTNKEKFEIPRNNICVEFLLLMKRNWLILTRNPEAMILRVIMTITNSFLTILVFSSLGTGDNAVQDRNGCLFYITNSVVQTNLQTNLSSFTKEYPKFNKEQENSMYGVVPYFFAKTLPEIPIQLFLSLSIFVCTYFLAGLNTESFDNYLLFILIIFVAGYAGSTFAVFLSSIIQNREIIPAIFPLLLYTQIQASGYLANVKNFPYIFYPFKYISVFRYCYQALCWNEYDNYTPESLDCTIPAKCKFPTNDFPEDLTWSILGLVILALANNFLAVTALKLKVMLMRKK